jgi:uncharacterized membrane protein
MTLPRTSTRRPTRSLGAEWLIGRLLIAITYLSVALLVIGVALMLRAGISPVAGGPNLDLSTLGSDLLAAGPAGFLWLGLLAVIAAPISRVIVAAVAYGRERDWLMVAIALGILSIIVIGVATAGAATV